MVCLHLHANLTLLVDFYCMLGMCCIIFLLDNIDFLVQFARQCDVFICDLVAIVKVCHGQLYSLYNDGNSSFFNVEF